MRMSRDEHESTLHMGRAGMTGFIDVVFLLLIFFLVTASIAPVEEDIASALASESEAGGRSADLQPIIVEIGRAGGRVSYSLGSRSTADRAQLQAWLEPLPKETGVFVRVLPSAIVDDIASGLRTCKDAGFTKVTYVPVGG